MKKAVFDTPNKMHFESEFKTFNRQTNYIGTGIIIANTQHSNYLRPWNEIKNYSYIGKPGDFCKYDFQGFREVPDRIKKIIFDKDRAHSVILYEFFIYINDTREIIGHVLTDDQYKYIAHSISCDWKQSYWKRVSAIGECMKYVCA